MASVQPTAPERKSAAPGRLERLLSRGIPLWLVLLILLAGAIGVILFGALVKTAAQADRSQGLVRDVALTIASIPSTLRQALAEPSPFLAGEGLPKAPDGFSRPAGSTFRDPGYALIARYSPSLHRSVVQLVRLADGRTMREYAPDIAEINRRVPIAADSLDLDRDRGPHRYRMKHPYLMPDGGIVFQNKTPLVRVDACSRIRWIVKGLYHHALERDAQGDFWIPVTKERSSRRAVSPAFADEGIARISPDGKLLQRVWMEEILARNGLAATYEGPPYDPDPFHMNDVEPVLTDGPHWKRGDLFLSSRHLSAVMLYRPSTGKMLWFRQGPWLGQHDVNILDDHRISVFDNQAVGGYPGDYVRGSNRLLVYDFRDGSMTSPFAAAMRQLGVRTVMEGRGTPLPNGDLFVEESNNGRLLRIAPGGQVRWQYFSSDAQGRRYQLAWSRYLDPAVHGEGIRAAISARCP